MEWTVPGQQTRARLCSGSVPRGWQGGLALSDRERQAHGQESQVQFVHRTRDLCLVFPKGPWASAQPAGTWPTGLPCTDSALTGDSLFLGLFSLFPG